MGGPKLLDKNYRRLPRFIRGAGTGAGAGAEAGAGGGCCCCRLFFRPCCWSLRCVVVDAGSAPLQAVEVCWHRSHRGGVFMKPN